MVYKIKLSHRAIKDIDQTISYLLQEWTVKEAKNFLNNLEEFKNIISKNPLIFPFHNKEKFIYKAVLTKHNIVFYQINDLDSIIYIITIFNVFQDSEKLSL